MLHPLYVAGHPDYLLGHQKPRIELIPDGTGNEAPEVIELAEYMGVQLLPWEKYSLAAGMRTEASGLWAAIDVVIVVARQNGKTVIVEVRHLGMAMLHKNQKITHTAHREDTAYESMDRMLSYLETHDDTMRKINKVSRSHGKEAIFFTNGSIIRFKTRTKDSGRGLGGDGLTFDESFAVTAANEAGMRPTLSAYPNPQIWWLSSPPDKAKHPEAERLAKLRRRALSGGEAAERLCYLEWSAPSGPDPDNPLKDLPFPINDPRMELFANPSEGADGLGPGEVLLTPRFIATERNSMGIREYATERLGIGFWPPEPLAEVAAETLFPERDVQAHAVDELPKITGKEKVCLAADMSPDRKWVSISAATLIGSGRIHLDLGRHEAPSRILVRYLISLCFKWDVVALVLDGASGILSILPELTQAGIEPEITTSREFAQACGGLYDDIVSAGVETVSYANDPLVMDGFAGCQKRQLTSNTNGGWALARNATSNDISPICSFALARYGLLAYTSTAPTSTGAFTPGMTTNPQLGGTFLPSRSSGEIDILNLRG